MANKKYMKINKILSGLHYINKNFACLPLIN